MKSRLMPSSRIHGRRERKSNSKSFPSRKRKAKSGYAKIQRTCEQVDTCCIDKTNNTELSEAINSMFAWNRDAKVCYAYLEDVDSDGSNLKDARWFARGWTLQELLAPTLVVFYSNEWKCIGRKSDLATSISNIIGIDKQV